MKKLILLALTIAFLPQVSSAADDACAKAKSLQSELKKKDPSDKSIDAARELLGSTETTESKVDRDKTFVCLIDLALAMLPHDDEGTTQDHLYDLHLEDGATFQKALRRLSKEDKAKVEKLLKDAKKLNDKGNG